MQPAEDMHPGPITNDDDLCDNNNPKNLRGTGTVEQFEPTHVDKYIKFSVSERYEFKVINQELWSFLYQKYGGSEIKRYSIPQGTYYTSIEVRLKQVPIVILPVSKLTAGGDALIGLDAEFNVQISKRKSYLDLKRRIVDCVNAKFGWKIAETDVRLWKYSDIKEKLVDAC